MHLLEPAGINLMLHKASIDDLKVDKLRLFGSLPDITLTVSEQRLLDVLQLLVSIPTPPPDPVDQAQQNVLAQVVFRLCFLHNDITDV